MTLGAAMESAILLVVKIIQTVQLNVRSALTLVIANGAAMTLAIIHVERVLQIVLSIAAALLIQPALHIMLQNAIITTFIGIILATI